MKKFKIGRRLITADSVIEAVKIAKLLDSPSTRVKTLDETIDELTKEEQQAVEDYREAIRNTSNTKLLKIYSHILEEETEHLQELAEAKEVDDACGKMKDDRLSPMTYKKLKELGVKPEQWQKWTQEQANEFIRNKGQKGSEKNAETSSSKEEQSKLSSREEFEKLSSSQKQRVVSEKANAALKEYQSQTGSKIKSFDIETEDFPKNGRTQTIVKVSSQAEAKRIASYFRQKGLDIYIGNGQHLVFKEEYDPQTQLGKDIRSLMTDLSIPKNTLMYGYSDGDVLISSKHVDRKLRKSLVSRLSEKGYDVNEFSNGEIIVRK